MALFTVLTGVIALVGAVLNGRYQRIREDGAVAHAWGMRGVSRVQIQLGGIRDSRGVLAAIVGGGLSIAGNALLAEFVFKVAPVAPPLLILGAVVTASAVTVVTGATPRAAA